MSNYSIFGDQHSSWRSSFKTPKSRYSPLKFDAFGTAFDYSPLIKLKYLEKSPKPSRMASSFGFGKGKSTCFSPIMNHLSHISSIMKLCDSPDSFSRTPGHQFQKSNHENIENVFSRFRDTVHDSWSLNDSVLRSDATQSFFRFDNFPLSNSTNQCASEDDTYVARGKVLRYSQNPSFCSSDSPLKVWSGDLPPKNEINPCYSRKVFLGGVPWDITEMDLQKHFNKFGQLIVDWPPTKKGQISPPKGYVYIVFDDERSVNNLLNHCREYNTHILQNMVDSSPYKYHVQSRKMKSKEIQVIPWNLNDSTKVIGPQDKVNMKHTIFVGGLHGMITATSLARIMNDLFGNVAYVEIDTDKYKYPLGSGRVIFCSSVSYQDAINCKYVKIVCKTPKIEKKIQIDPYIRDSEYCSKCGNLPGPLYCRTCLVYFCNECWSSWHVTINEMHEYVSRDRKSI